MKRVVLVLTLVSVAIFGAQSALASNVGACHLCGCNCTTSITTQCADVMCADPPDCSAPGACNNPTTNPISTIRPHLTLGPIYDDPTETPVGKPTDILSCDWCGDECRDSRIKMVCSNTNIPPVGKVCVSDGSKCKVDTGACLQCQSGVYPKSEGNAVVTGSCNDRVDLLDFSAWRKDYLSENSGGVMPTEGWSADFDCSGNVDLLDFSAWRKGYLRYQGQAPTVGPTSIPTPALTNTPVPTLVPTVRPTVTPTPTTTACAAGEVVCGGVCVNTLMNVNNCGNCGHQCVAGSLCISGVCVLLTPTSTPVACATGEIVCGGACVNVATNSNNCGTCGNQCVAGRSCVSGACVLLTPTPTSSGLLACGDRCTTNSECESNDCRAISPVMGISTDKNLSVIGPITLKYCYCGGAQ